MDLKKTIFLSLIFAIIIFPVLFYTSPKQISSQKITLPNIIVKNGKFETYTISLDKNGSFSNLNYYTQQYYTINNLKVKLCDKNSTLLSQTAIYKNIWIFEKNLYKTPTLKYFSNISHYNPSTKELTSEKFTFFNNKIEGKGEQMVYKNDILTAKNIIYKIKVKDD